MFRRASRSGHARRLILRLSRQLGAMPNRNDPDCAILDAIEESIGWHDHLPVWKVGKFRNSAPGFRKGFKFSEHGLDSPSNAERGVSVVPPDVG
jgi:hypothetical protein